MRGGEPSWLGGDRIDDVSLVGNTGKVVFTVADLDVDIVISGLKSTKVDWEPTISPNGRRIAYVSDRTGTDAIWISDRLGEQRKQVTFGASIAAAPSWSPSLLQLACTKTAFFM